MQIITLKILKLFIVILYFISNLFSDKKQFKRNCLIVGNYDHISIEQEDFLKALTAASIDHRFVFTTEKSSMLKKIWAYSHLTLLLPYYKNIIVFDYCFPLYCVNKKTGQKHIQMWHANGSFKQFGLPNFYKKYGKELGDKLYNIVPIHSTYDYVFVSSEKCIPHYMEAFGIFDRDKFIVCNNMILNILIDQYKKADIKNDNNKITIVLAPTYNYESKKDIYRQLNDHLIELGSKAGKEIEFLQLLHPKFNKETGKVNILLKTDVLITDYSSVCFEAAAAGCEIAFLRNDEQEPVDVFEEAATHVYFDPYELANDIVNNTMHSNNLLDYISDNTVKQIDVVIDILKEK